MKAGGSFLFFYPPCFRPVIDQAGKCVFFAFRLPNSLRVQLQKFGRTCVQDHGWNGERLLTETPLCSKNTEGFWADNGLTEDEENQVGEH